jgi:hypothetical protein
MRALRSDASASIAPESPRDDLGLGGAGKRGQRFQIGVRDLAVWVVGAAIISVLVQRFLRSGAVDSIGNRFGNPFGNPRDVLVLSLGVLVPLVGIGVRLAGQVIRLGHAPVAAGAYQADRLHRHTAIAWRLGVLALLAFLTAGIVAAWAPSGSSLSPTIQARLYLRLYVFPLCGLIATLGLLIGMRPPAPLVARPARTAWFGVALAGAVGVGVAAAYMPIPYLVLVALEAVANAMRGQEPQVQRPGLATRINHAGPPAALAVAAALATAAWISSDLRRAATASADERVSGRS